MIVHLDDFDPPIRARVLDLAGDVLVIAYRHPSGLEITSTRRRESVRVEEDDGRHRQAAREALRAVRERRLYTSQLLDLARDVLLDAGVKPPRSLGARVAALEDLTDRNTTTSRRFIRMRKITHHQPTGGQP